MTTNKTKDLHVAEDPIQINRDLEDKEYSEHVEQAEYGKTGVRDIEYDDQEDPEHSRKGMRKLLRRNPSYNFIRDVAVADETPLDSGQVKRVRCRLSRMCHTDPTAGEATMDDDRARPLYRLHLLLC